MAIDYDAPRNHEEEDAEPVDGLAGKEDGKASARIDVDDDIEAADDFELPGADLSGEELAVQVIPIQADEFTCSRCFLVHHHSQLAYQDSGRPVCAECAA